MGLVRASALVAIVSATVPVYAGDCFCVVDADDNFRYGCAEQRQGIRRVYLCQASDDMPIKMSDLNGWQQVQNGEGRCRPCRRRQVDLEGDIRGQDDAKDADE